MHGRSDVTLALDAKSLNGEGPVWCEKRRRLYWIDVRRPSFHDFDPASGESRAWDLPALAGSFALTPRGAVLALRTGLFTFDFATGALHHLAPAPFDVRRLTFNDGGCDPAGRFLAGPMYLPLDPAPGGGERGGPLWRYDGSTGWTALTPPVETSNGLAFSPDGRRMYHADTKARTVWSYDYDPATGTPSNRRVFAVVEGAGDGGPDGAAVDRDGFYWSAIFGGGCLLRFDPDGRLERRVDFPVRYPTMPAFGGDDLATVFVTSANWPLAPEKRPGSVDGGIFTFPAPVPGPAPRHFALGDEEQR